MSQQKVKSQPTVGTRVDPVTGAVIQGALENIAIEMGHKLMRMSYSSIIRESEDFGTALTDGIHPSRAAGFWAPRVVTSVDGDR